MQVTIKKSDIDVLAKSARCIMHLADNTVNQKKREELLHYFDRLSVMYKDGKHSINHPTFQSLRCNKGEIAS